jgi:regulator of replication initiation timing
VTITDQLRELVDAYQKITTELRGEIVLLEIENDNLQRQLAAYEQTRCSRDEVNEVAKMACGFKG